jgi:cytoplasmic iron level regulating protein YaaA (DUF328/UPF0246 family)
VPELTKTRAGIARDLLALCRRPQHAAQILGLGPKNMDYLESNRALLDSATLPAIERYTGVVFDALDYASLSDSSRAVAHQSLWIFSALFGPLRATDPIPRYRLSFDTRIPGESLKARWLPQADRMWADTFTIDLRSEGYRDLAPLPPGRGVFVRFVRDLAGQRAVGHANKATKGRLVRALILQGPELSDVSELCDWGHGNGWNFQPSDSTEDVHLVIDEKSLTPR